MVPGLLHHLNYIHIVGAEYETSGFENSNLPRPRTPPPPPPAAEKMSALGDDEAVEAVRQRFARDLHSLGDENKGTRSRAIKRLHKAFSSPEFDPSGGGAAGEGRVHALFFDRELRERLLSLLSDASEKCRELSCQLLAFFLGKLLPSLCAPEAEAACAARLLRSVAEVASTRIGALPFEEPAEEVRLQLVELLRALVEKCAARPDAQIAVDALSDVCESVCGTCAKALADNFPEVKRATAELILLVSGPDASPRAVRLRQAPLIKGLVGNLSHQHSRTRAITLKALGAVVACGSDDARKLWLDDLSMPLQTRVLYDRSPNVRRQLFRTCALWLAMQAKSRAGASAMDVEAEADAADVDDAEAAARLGQAKPYLSFGDCEGDLLAILLAGTKDDHAQVAADAGKLLRDVGDLAEGADDGGAGGDAAAMAYVVRLLPSMLPKAIADASHWTADGREKALRRLEALANYAGRELEGRMPELLAVLASAIADDTREVASAAAECCAVLSSLVDGDAFLDALLPRASGRAAGGATAGAMAGHMALLAAALRSGSLAAGESALAQRRALRICEALAADAAVEQIVDDERGALALAAGRAAVGLLSEGPLGAAAAASEAAVAAAVTCAGALLANGFEGGGSAAARIEAGVSRGGCGALEAVAGAAGDASADEGALVASLASDEDLRASPSSHGAAALVLLAKRGGGRLDALLAGVVPKVLAGLAGAVVPEGAGGGGALWEPSAFQLRVFDALARCCGEGAAAEAALATVLAVVARHVEGAPGEDFERRLFMLALLDDTLLRARGSAKLAAFAPVVILKCVAPNIVWRAGRAAAMVRKVALAALETLLASGKVGPAQLVACAQQVMPTLKSCLDDADATTRRLATLSLRAVLEALPGQLGEDAVYAMYHDLSKKLDDSDDGVRMASCATLGAFYRAAAPGALRGTMAEWSAQCLLVHMDDPDGAVQRAVYELLGELVRCGDAATAKAVRRKAEEARLQHRTTDLCDRLVAMATEAERA